MIAEPLRYRITDHPDRTVIKLVGEVDFSHVDELRSLLTAARCRAPYLEVDLSEVVFIDACGISVLVRAHGDAVAVGRRLAVTNPTGQVRQAFEITGVLALLAGGCRPRLGCGGSRSAVRRSPAAWRPVRPIRCLREMPGNDGRPRSRR